MEGRDALDRRMMNAALALARRGLGETWPNPTVGCVIVRDSVVVGRGRTARGGRPHAETAALARAGDAARGADVYVTLEPCSHHGKTPPCADALIAAGPARVVVALGDPDPRVSGRGIERLSAAGILVEVGLGAEEAEAINRGFLTRVRLGRPMFTLKVATTLDGRIATRTGDSRWITGPEARARAHLARAEHDAIMIGVGTALADDPDLTCRLPGLESRSPVRVVLAGRRLPPVDGRLARSARRTPLWVVVGEGTPIEATDGLRDLGAEIIVVPSDGEGRPDARAAAATLGARGITRVLVEGGGRLAAALSRADLVDRVLWFHAPKWVGGDGLPAIDSLGLDRIADAPLRRRVFLADVGADVMEVYERARREKLERT